MKLYRVNYIDDCNFETCLAVGNSSKEVEERVTEKLVNQCSCFMSCHVLEIDEVDGHKIIVE